jgi:hypothetical protein
MRKQGETIVKLPIQAQPVIRGITYNRPIAAVQPQGCAVWDAVKCSAIGVGTVAAAVAAVGTGGAAAVGAVAGAVAFIAECRDCVDGGLLHTMCGAFFAANQAVYLGPEIAYACRGYGGW